MHRVIQHRRQRVARAREQVLADDHQRDTGRAQVLLRAGVDQRVTSDTSIGRLKMSDDVSLTSGTSPTSGSVCHSVPSIVLFDVMWTYAAPGVSLSSDRCGNARVVVGLGGRRDVHVPTFFASFIALSAHVAGDRCSRRSRPARAGSSAPSRTAGWRRPAGTAPCNSPACGQRADVGSRPPLSRSSNVFDRWLISITDMPTPGSATSRAAPLRAPGAADGRTGGKIEDANVASVDRPRGPALRGMLQPRRLCGFRSMCTAIRPAALARTTWTSAA